MDWQARIDAVWADDSLDDTGRMRAIDALSDELAATDPRGLFERAGARDSAGLEAEAEPLYRAALAGGLDADRSAQAVIQLASTLRNLGRSDEAIRMLRDEVDREPPSPLRDEALAFLALALVSDGDARSGASVALVALAPHLSRYRRAVALYAEELTTSAG